MALGAIGGRPDGGVDRQALTEGEAAAWRLVIGWAREAGLEPGLDPAGNLFLTRAGRARTLPPLLLGSHLDTQPNGGRFDGAFGVLAALEAASTIEAPLRDIVVVSWMNEEGSRFAPGMMGSEAFAGVRGLNVIRAARDADGVTAGAALDLLLAAFPDLPRRPLGFKPHAYLEAHIEQGPVLEAAGVPIGIVTGIQGKVTFEAVVEGREGHAGTLDMAARQDALLAFCRLALALQSGVGEADPAVKWTIGRLEVTPNAPSVVPGRVVFRADLRHPDAAMLRGLAARVETMAAAHAASIRRLVDAPPTVFDAGLSARLAQAASALGHRSMPILSAAGHDARHIATLCPAAMLFIPCRGGISHSPDEWAGAADVVAGCDVLRVAATGLACDEATG